MIHYSAGERKIYINRSICFMRLKVPLLVLGALALTLIAGFNLSPLFYPPPNFT